MTQALLNNLNIIKENRFGLKDKGQIDSGISFEKILDLTNAKTVKEQIKDIKENKDIKFNKQMPSDNTSEKQVSSSIDTEKSEVDMQVTQTDTEQIDKTDDAKLNNTVTEITIKDKDNNTDNEIDKNESLQAVIIEKTIESAAEDCLTDAFIQETTNLIAETKTEETDSTKTAEEDEEQETVTENTNIEEAPTMNKELITLENPTAAIILQTQIKTSKQVLPEHESSENQVGKENSIRKDEILNSNSRQFESSNTDKTIVNFISKTEKAEKTEPSKAKIPVDEKIVKELNVTVRQDGISDGETGNGFMQEPSPQEQVVKVMLNNDIKTSSNFSTALKSEVIKTEIATPSKIIEQISKQLENIGSGSKLTMVLNPENLGKINIQLLNTKNGLTAQFTVTTQDAKDLLMKGLDGLKENLLAQGVNVDSVTVRFEETGDGDNLSDWTEQDGSRGGNKQQKNKHTKDEQTQQFEQLMFEYDNGK